MAKQARSNSGFVWAYDCDGQGGGASIGVDALSLAGSQSLRWVHLVATSKSARKLASESLGIPLEAVSLLFQADTRPQLSVYPEGLVVNLRGLNFNEGAELEDMISVRMWVSESLVVTVRKSKLMAANDIRKRIDDGTGPIDGASFLEMVSKSLLDRLQTVVDALEDRTDRIEDSDFRNVSAARVELKSIRMIALKIRRYIGPQRDALHDLTNVQVKWISDENRVSFGHRIHQVTRYIENIDLARDRAKVVQDELAVAVSEQMNRNMYVLSIVAAVFLPLSLATGLFGINVGGIPGSTYVGAFWIFTGALAVSGILLGVVFKWLRWF